LVVAGGVEGQVAEGFAVLVEDADVAVCDEQDHAGVLVGATEADVVESALVAEADAAGRVDFVVADAEVGGGDRRGRAGFEAGFERLAWGAPVEGAVGRCSL
jgi:hypothetical protein